MSDIATLLSQSSLASASEAAQALRSGWSLSTPRNVDIQDLSRTYRIRLEHLRSKPGPHAAQLADSVAELLLNLETAEDAKSAVLEGPEEHLFYIFLSDSSAKVLGCIKGVSKLKVSSERWKDLWQGAV